MTIFYCVCSWMLSIYLSHEGYIGLFYTLAVMGMHVFLWDADNIFLGYLHRSGIPASYGRLSFNFWGIFILLSIVAILIYILTMSAKQFLFLYNHISTFKFCLLDNRHIKWGEVVYLPYWVDLLHKRYLV
jgi:hypothetical protein